MSEQAPTQTPTPTPTLTKAQIKREKAKLRAAAATVIAYCVEHPQQLGGRSFLTMKNVIIDGKEYGDWHIAVVGESPEHYFSAIGNRYVRITN